jgi:hypothetical protein
MPKMPDAERPPEVMADSHRSHGEISKIPLADAALLQHLGRGLQDLYAPMVVEQVPEHLTNLLERLDRCER